MRQIVKTVQQKGLAADVVAVISNTADAAALNWAKERNITTHVVPHTDYATREAFDAALAQKIKAYQPNYILLAGFMRILTPSFVEQFEGKLINIHPSLLPAFPGLKTHQQALLAGVQCHGCTIHFVTAQLDDGPIIAQGITPVLANDTEATLAARVLHAEHICYAAVVQWLAEGRVLIEPNGKVTVSGVEHRAFFVAEQATA